MNKRRLLKLAGLLEADAKNKKGIKFNLGVWAAPADGTDMSDRTEPAVDCNTQACAVGLACISGAFKRQGLTYVYRMGFFGNLILIPKFRHRREFSAVQAFFGISEVEAEWLFQPGSYAHGVGAKGERAVAKRLRDFVAGKAQP